ncbi:unnamed protein product [Effrenium voratum]|nr:unnamed protein product [Effrenium voratum]
MQDEMDYVRESNIEAYTVGDLGDRKIVEQQVNDARTVEYTDKHQTTGLVLRLSQATMALIDGKVVNVDFYIKSVCKTGEEDDNEEDAMLVPIYVGAISSKYVGEDNRLTGDRRAAAAEGFFGCDEFGHLYVSGHRTEDKFGGFRRGSTVGVEIDYTDETKRAMFIIVDGFRVGAIRREVDEGMVPCVILNGMGQVVRVNVGRPRRGKGLLVKREDTIQEEWQSIFNGPVEPDTTVVHLSYQVGKDQWCTRVKSDEGSKSYKEGCIYEGWNSAFAVQTKDAQLAKLEKIKAFSRHFQVDSRAAPQPAQPAQPAFACVPEERRGSGPRDFWVVTT